MIICKINFFEPRIWQKGALLKQIERQLAVVDDPYGSGRWQPAMAPGIFEKYKKTLGGRPIESYDPRRSIRRTWRWASAPAPK